MRLIPLNLLSLYSDTQQRIALAGVPAASISRKKVGSGEPLYAVVKDGATRRQVYLGPSSDPVVAKKAAAHVKAGRDRAMLKKSVQALKSGGIPSPDVSVGRVLEALAATYVFERCAARSTDPEARGHRSERAAEISGGGNAI